MEDGTPAQSKTCGNGIKKAFSHPIASFLAGFRFLTIVPISWKQDKDQHYFKASLLWFPLLGLCIGGITSLFISLVSGYLPGSVLAVAGMVLLAGISGCLHLDGLADSFDGLLSSRPRKRALEIMRDSHVGAMGVLGLIFVLLGKYAALSSLDPIVMLQAFILIPMTGRLAILLSMAILPYARKNDGLGLLFYSPDSRYIALFASLYVFVIVTFFSFVSILLLIFAILTPLFLFSFWCQRKLGGATGDTLGAICELTELSVAVAFCVSYSV